MIPSGLKYEPPKLPEYNYVDQLVDAKLQKLRITPSPLHTAQDIDHLVQALSAIWSQLQLKRAA